VGATLRTRRRENQTPTSRRHGVRGSARLPQGGEALLPLLWGLGGRCGSGRRHAAPPVASAARAGTSAARAASLMGRLEAMLPRLSQALSPRPPPRLWARGAQAPTSRGELSPRRSPPPTTMTTNTPRTLRRESLLLAQPKLLTPLFPALSPPDSLLLARRPLLLPPLRCARALGLGAWAGRIARRPRSPAAGGERQLRPCRRLTDE
jgi:hypothetical protein